MAGAGGWWAVADYRIERSLGAACTISRDAFPTAARNEAGPLDTLARACEVLAGLEGRCASVDPATAQQCAAITSPHADVLRLRATRPVLLPAGAMTRAPLGWPGVHLPAAIERGLSDALGAVTLSTGGERCPTEVPQRQPGLFLVLGGKGCLAFRTGDRTVVTAAHCLQTSQEPVATRKQATWRADPDSSGFDLTCEPIKANVDFRHCPDKDRSECWRDVAVCTLQANTSSAAIVAMKDIEIYQTIKQRPPGQSFQQELKILSAGQPNKGDGLCLKFDTASGSVPIPTGPDYVVAQIKPVKGRPPLSFGLADSGGVALLVDRAPASSALAMGVNTMHQNTAYIAPLWLP